MPRPDGRIITGKAAALAVAQFPKLMGCEIHSTQILHSGDESILMKMYINLTCEPVFPDKNLLF